MVIYVSLSLLLNDKIRFLVGFISAAVVLAGILIFAEYFLRKKEKEKNRRLQQTPADRIKIYLSSQKSLQDKLAFMDKMGKSYFKDTYGLPETSSYSSLIKELEKKGKDVEVEFCKLMFAAFYSKNGTSKDQIKDIGKKLIEIEQHRTVEKKDLEDVRRDKIKVPFVDVKKKIQEKESAIDPEKKTKESLQKQELIVGDVKRLAAEDEARTKREIEETKRSDEKKRREFQRLEQEKKEAQKRIEDRKNLVEDRISRRNRKLQEKKEARELARKRKEDAKQRKKEMYWRARAEKQERAKQRDRERLEMKKLAEERKKQKRREQRELKEAKVEKLKMERIGLNNNSSKEDSSSGGGGIASRIISSQKQRLEGGSI